MSAKQDRTYTRIPEQMERKYDMERTRCNLVVLHQLIRIVGRSLTDLLSAAVHTENGSVFVLVAHFGAAKSCLLCTSE